jgi:thymidylate kinase
MKKTGILIAIYGDSGLTEDCEHHLFSRAFSKLKGKRISEVKIYGQIFPSKKVQSAKSIDRYWEEKPVNFSPLDFHRLCIWNQIEFEREGLKELLILNDIVITRSYIGTSIAYGLTKKEPKKELINFTFGLIEPKISIFFDNEKFNKDSAECCAFRLDVESFKKMNLAYSEIASDLGWHVVRVGRALHEYRFYEEIFHAMARVYESKLVH